MFFINGIFEAIILKVFITLTSAVPIVENNPWKILKPKIKE